MGGVDPVDQQLHGINPLRKLYKCYKMLTFRIIMEMVLNAQKTYVSLTGTNITLASFIIKEITRWVTIHEGLPINRPADETRCKRYHVCYAKGFRAANGYHVGTRFKCYCCPSVPGLHPEGCFELYHTKEDYSQDI